MLTATARALARTLSADELLKAQDVGFPVEIVERAMRAMLRDARKWASLETMGPIFMSGNLAAGFRVELAAPSGPNSEHLPLTTYPNVEYYNRWVAWVWRRRPKLQFAGQWHTHPFEDDPCPSLQDIWGVNIDRAAGWFHWNEGNADYFANGGHLEIIMGRRQTRAWWVTNNPDRIRLVCEVSVGILR